MSKKKEKQTKEVKIKKEPDPKIWLRFLPSGFVLFIYPMVLMANFMMAAAIQTGEEITPVIRVVQTFLWVSTLYPVTYFASLIAYKVAKENEKKIQIAKWPYYHLAFAVALFVLWAALDR